jgi:hypothetical protein
LETNANLENFTRIADLLAAKSQRPGSLDYLPYESPGSAFAFWRTNGQNASSSNAMAGPYVNWAELSEEMQASADLLAEIRSELEHPPRRFGWNLTNPFAPNQPRNPFVQKRKVAQFLAADSMVALHENQLARAQTNLHSFAQMTQIHRDDYLLISAMIRAAIAGLWVSETWQALQADGWSDGALAELQRDWEGLDLIASVENGFIGERAFGQLSFALARTDEAKADEILSAFGRSGSSSSATRLAQLRDRLHERMAKFYWRGHIDEDEMFHLQDSQMQLENLRKLRSNTSGASLRIKNQAQSDALEKAFEQPLAKYRYLLSSISIPNFTRACDTALQRETERRMVITVIALKRYQLRNGHLPVALAELPPQFLSSELMDPWSGKLFHYRLNADGSFVLYSVGMDGRDDGGDPSPEKPGKTSKDMWSGKDALWPKAIFPQAK